MFLVTTATEDAVVITPVNVPEKAPTKLVAVTVPVKNPPPLTLNSAPEIAVLVPTAT